MQKKQPDFGFLSHNSPMEVGLCLKMSEVEGWYHLHNYSFWKVTVVSKNYYCRGKDYIGRRFKLCSFLLFAKKHHIQVFLADCRILNGSE
jgi:hypothetical protein